MKLCPRLPGQPDDPRLEWTEDASTALNYDLLTPLTANYNSFSSLLMFTPSRREAPGKLK